MGRGFRCFMRTVVPVLGMIVPGFIASPSPALAEAFKTSLTTGINSNIHR